MNVYEKYFEKNLGREFPIYGYSPPNEGKWQIDDTVYYTEDFRTVERYREYKDAGFNVLFLQSTATYYGEDWATSQTKMVMERAVEAGLNKIILVDQRIFDLSLIEGGIIGEGKKFASEAELDDFIRDCIKDYRQQKGFYGVQLRDEPFHPFLKSIGQIYRSLRRVDSKIFVHCNLNPLIVPNLAYQICPAGKSMIEAYENYLTMFLEETGTDHIMVDIYPFDTSPDKTRINRYYFACLECIARVCKKYNKEMHIVMQSFAMDVRNKHRHWIPSEKEMQYQKNVMIAFGVKQYSYFTYWTKQMNRTNGEMFIDGKALMTRNGEKTKTYYHVQRVNRELNKLAPLLWDFKYCANAFFVKPPFCGRPTYLEMARGGQLTQVTNVETDREVVMVSEQYDKKHKQYMYCVVNTADVRNYTRKHGSEKQATTLTFADGYNVVDVYERGNWKTLPLKDGKLTVFLLSGEGAIVLPYYKNQ